jgi:hypothetical protein
MRLLRGDSGGGLVLTEDYVGDEDVPPYAILSHTWTKGDEVTFKDLIEGTGRNKAGFSKIQFCGEQARLDGLQYFWVDTCCIDKSSSAELTEAINSMFRWYQNAAKCYVYLVDLSVLDSDLNSPPSWESAFRASRWFTRGWTLQELLAPSSIEFFTREGKRLGDRTSLAQQIHEVTKITLAALLGGSLTRFSVAERLSWVGSRETTRQEDLAYSMLGIFDVSMPLIYGEGRDKAFNRLQRKIARSEFAIAQYDPLSSLELFSQNTLSPEIGQKDQGAAIDSTRQSLSTGSGQHIPVFQSKKQAPSSGSSTVRSIREQTLSAVTAIVEETQHAVILGQHDLHHRLAQIYCELSKDREQLKRLALLLEPNEVPERKRIRTPSRPSSPVGNSKDTKIRCVEQLSPHASHDITDLFFGCVTAYSDKGTNTTFQRSRARFSGAPNYFFEGSPNYFPEQYSIVSKLLNKVVVAAMFEVSSTSTYRLHKYYLVYPEAARTWRRVIICATIVTSSPDSCFSRMSSPAMEEGAERTLPGNLQSLLERALKGKALLETVTNITLTVIEDSSGISIDDTALKITEDLDESKKSNDDRILQDISDLGCPRYVQNDISVRSRQYPFTYLVQIGSQPFVEHKIPFAMAGLPGENKVSDFFDEIKMLHALRDCRGVIKFGGVVLDDTQKNLTSYLCVWPALGRFGNITQAIRLAEAKGERIPWAIRETWAKQVVAAVAEVHEKGFVVGNFSHDSVIIKADGTAALNPRKSRQDVNGYGRVAPELRSSPWNSPSPKELTFRTDIFQLGHVLWFLAKHIWVNGQNYCPNSACSDVALCGHPCEEHDNPVELPSCSNGEVPPYIDIVISHCRHPDPRARFPARELLQFFPDKDLPCDAAMIVSRYAEVEDDHRNVPCNICRTMATNLHYHCNACNFGDFDLCPNCVSQGDHCFDPEHRLVKRTCKDGIFISVLDDS